ncbi:response regulator [Paenibacillus sp. N3.4]|uniref:response regulator n=1 Tax=Paenibacillus sp. N3.4 TaxID=2603222 RepID=UPI00164FFE55|nr:response regulator [Paenibacillus sp. N3.4]
MRIVIADDEYYVQESLISMIAEIESSWSIVGIASDGNELVKLIKEHQPDLAIVDIRMPYLSGLEAIRIAQNECPYLQCIVLTGYSEFSFAQEAIQLGASNYLLKPVGIEELKSSLEAVNHKLKMRNDLVNKNLNLP